MKLSIKLIVVPAILGSILWSCKRDDLDMDLFSDTYKIERTIAMPLGYGDLYLKDLMTETDSILIIEADSSFTDTLGLDLGEDVNDLELEYFNLYHKTLNYLPISVDLALVTFDSVSQRNLDTIKFIENDIFLKPAPIDAHGDVIVEQVDTIQGILAIDHQRAENVLNIATHIIFEARLISDTTVVIPIDDNKRIWLKYGFEAKGSYTSKSGN
jgi:hypothetical protein